MIKNLHTRRTIALLGLVFLMIFKVNAQGPNAPEAASFEPVDATDMVNLSTGDFTYVLPLLNIPSPEGGYPISLAYHAGIAMNQESSWVGLGWNLNPGAINRSVNGMPDDYLSASVIDHLYSSEEKVSHFNASIGYSYGVGSVGLGFSWGSNKSLGGSISIGIGVEGVGQFGGSIGTGGVGLNASIGVAGGLSLGASYNSSSGISGSLGFNSNGTGFNVSTTGSFGVSFSGTTDKGSSVNVDKIGINFSSSGVGISLSSSSYKSEGEGANRQFTKTGSQGGGFGFASAFNNTNNMGDVSSTASGFNIPLVVPTSIGVFSFSFGKQDFKYWVNNIQNDYVTGAVNFSKIGGYMVIAKSTKEHCITTTYGESCSLLTREVGTVPYIHTVAEIKAVIADYHDFLVTWDVNNYELKRLNDRTAMDINELSVVAGDIGDEKNIFEANPNLPNYDKYVVQAQGLSGAITPRVFENGAIYGFSNKVSSDNVELDYLVNDEIGVPSKFRFQKKTQFYFENEISTYIDIPKPTLDMSILTSTSNTSEKTSSSNRRKTANHIEYYTNLELRDNLESIKMEGFIGSQNYSRFFYDELSIYKSGAIPENGIGAFKITGIDGKTYHYTIPVYNHELIQRTYGTMEYQDGRKGIKPENEAYFEKKQTEAYATHWLLTSITGPDFVDKNSNGFADDSDYGYWVNFEYGKYSGGSAWSAPYGKEYIEDSEDKNIKTWIKGRKDVYYLDNINTRTHIAYFVKSEREDSKSTEFKYDAAYGTYGGDLILDELTYINMFTIPVQKTLKLDKILLVKKSNGTIATTGTFVNKASGQVSGKSESIRYRVPAIGSHETEIKTANYIYDNMNAVIDSGDDFSSLEGHVIRSIEFDNDNYDLVKGTPNSDANGRLTLKGVSFKGKNETSIMPPYKFEYNNSSVDFNIDNEDNYGFYKKDPSLWSLNKITTPEGGEIKVDYEKHIIEPVIKSNVIFTDNYEQQEAPYLSSNNPTIVFNEDSGNTDTAKVDIANVNNITSGVPLSFIIDSENDYGIAVGDDVDISYSHSWSIKKGGKCIGDCYDLYQVCNYNRSGVISESLGGNKFLVRGKTVYFPCLPANEDLKNFNDNEPFISSITLSIKYKVNNPIENGGIRVKSISTVDQDRNEYSINYLYGHNGDGIGYVPYLPYAPDLTEEIPYSSELPSPKPMYDYVTTTMSAIKNGQESTREEYGVRNEYNFNVLKEKTEDEIKFGDFYELTSNQTQGTTSSNTQLHEFTIKDNLGAIGQLLSVKTYSQKGHLLYNIQNSYYEIEETPDKLGVTQESYQTYKKLEDEDNNIKNLGTTSTRITYPTLLKNSTELKGGFSYTSEFNDLDPITGQARETYSYSSTGMKFLTRGIQAYKKYSQMGSKVDNPNNKNMLSQTAGEYNYLIDENGDEQIVGATIETWNNNWTYKFFDNTTEETNNAWRKHKTYVWNGVVEEGIYKDFVDDFEWGVNVNQSSKWKKTSEITRYNQFSHPLEVKDVNANYVATKMADDYSKVIATSDANYDEMYYSGAENIKEPELVVNLDDASYADSILGSSNLSSSVVEYDYFDGTGIKSAGYLNVLNNNGISDAHTGNYVVEVGENGKAFEVDVPARLLGKTAFKVSVWVRKGDEDNVKIRLNNVNKSFNTNESIIAGNWVLLRGYITIPQSGANVAITSTSGTVRLDDFRLLPVSSGMTSYVYNEWDEVSYIMGANGLSTHYIYDAAGRLIETQIEVVDQNQMTGTRGGFKRVSTNSYNYKNQ